MSLKNTQILADLAAVVSAAWSPASAPCKVITTIISDLTELQLGNDFAVTDPTLGANIIRAVIIRPGKGTEERASTGNQGFFHSEQAFDLTALISISQQLHTENYLEDDFDTIRAAIRKVGRIDPSQSAFNTGKLEWSEISTVKFAKEFLCHSKTLTAYIQDRQQGF